MGGLLAMAQTPRFEPHLAALRRYGAWLLLPVVLIIPFRPALSFLQPAVVGLAGVYLVEQARVGFPGLIGKLFSLPLVIYLGQISYGIYAYHQAPRLMLPPELFVGLPVIWRTPDLAAAAVYTLMTIAFAALSWRFFEQPINRLKARVS